jgi:hypothetical protein
MSIVQWIWSPRFILENKFWTPKKKIRSFISKGVGAFRGRLSAARGASFGREGFESVMGGTVV